MSKRVWRLWVDHVLQPGRALATRQRWLLLTALGDQGLRELNAAAQEGKRALHVRLQAIYSERNVCQDTH